MAAKETELTGNVNCQELKLKLTNAFQGLSVKAAFSSQLPSPLFSSPHFLIAN